MSTGAVDNFSYRHRPRRHALRHANNASAIKKQQKFQQCLIVLLTTLFVRLLLANGSAACVRARLVPAFLPSLSGSCPTGPAVPATVSLPRFSYFAIDEYCAAHGQVAPTPAGAGTAGTFRLSLQRV
ncbi:hypothetical protein CNECB9_950008 [Cupriavidus necator]|uniref:Uncharacterized protein n=1 Tax=Cupriavidus necator TaxID=106590 RepID=A0A1K0ISK1_CUPNE|nr:hypothetical protein CNECB9_950008 [Cupriavidus necator]